MYDIFKKCILYILPVFISGVPDLFILADHKQNTTLFWAIISYISVSWFALKLKFKFKYCPYWLPTSK